jgi:uncharacterized repeat protein (TIGR01451 family)
MNNTSLFRFKSILIVTLLLLIKGFSFAQTNSQFMQEANSNGFFLKKVVSDTTIASGQTFSYTLYFSIPAGATNVNLIDVLPNALTFQGYSVSAVCGTMNVTSAPTVGNQGGTLQLNFPSVPSGCSGSVSMTVKFPAGTTCNGTGVRNNVCMNGNVGPVKTDFCTGFVSTSATAINPWQIGKSVVGAAFQGGTCPNVTLDSIITYRICVSKIYGTNGQLNLVNGVVTDVLPSGATLVSSTCGVTQAGNTLTWNVGNMAVTPPYNQQCCDIQVKYPRALFPIGSQITNSATLTGGLGSAQPTCGQFTQNSNQTCVEIKGYVQGSFAKYAYTTGQPGCGGYYWIQFCNTGTLPITGLTITDNLPAGLTGYSTSNGAGVTSSISGGVMTATYAGTLAPGGCAYVQVNFTIPNSATVGSTINNCATATYTGLTTPIQACAPFVVTAPAAKACIWKEICSPQASYTAGQIVRYRLRVQNIGGQAITGASITDILNPNLQYVGNPTYYSTTVYNSPCSNPALPSGATAWTGLTASQSGQTLTWNLPTIGASCQNLFYQYCSNYGNFSVPFYYIEFDVKIVDTACIGNIPNFFAISGGNVTAQNSNTEYVNVVGTAAFNLDKTVSKDNGATYAASTAAPAGSNVRFKLKFTPSVSSTTAMRHVTYVDLMPRSNGAGDLYVLNRASNRGSAFDLNFQNVVSTTPTATGGYDVLNSANAKVNGILIPTVGTMFPYAGGVGVPTWTNPIINTPIPVNSKNLTAYFGTTAILAAGAEAVFNAQIPAGTTAQLSSCNSFAANAATCHLINSSLMTNQAMAPLESGTACVSATPSVFVCCDSVKIVNPVITNNKCCSRITATCDIKSIKVVLTNGTISGAAFSGPSAACYANPAPAIGQTSYTFNPASSACVGFDLQICANATVAGNVILDYLITFSNGQECRRFDTLKCEVIPPVDCCKETQVISYDNVDKCCSQLITKCPVKLVTVSVLNGTLGNVTFAGTTASFYTGLTNSALTTANFGASSSPTGGIDMTTCPISANNGNPVYINYVIYFTDGTECKKSDTLKCAVTPINCCEGVKIVPAPNLKCCSQLTTTCPVRQILVNVISGGLLGNVSFSGTSASSYTGVTGSSATLMNFMASTIPTTGLDITVCPKITANPTIIRYTITFMNGTQCEKLDTIKCTPPTTDCIISACIGYTATGLSTNFNASGTTSNQPIVMYVWNFGDGQYTTTTTPLVNHVYAANGTYKVCMTVHTLYNGSICGCVKEVCKEVKVQQGATSTSSCTSGLTSGGGQSEVGRIVASPNPSSADFHITLENATDILSESGSELKLMNLQGQTVFTKKLAIGEKELDIQAVTLPAGLYLVSLLKDGEVMSTVKVVKN